MTVDSNQDLASFDPSQPTISGIDTLIIGCGNLLRGDDAAGPVLIRRMWQRGLPDHVHCADGGTGGMDVAFQMRGVRHVILVDACCSESEPGAIFEVPGEEVAQLPPIEGINLHSFRWDHAIAFAKWLLKDDYPDRITVYLIEGAEFRVGESLSAEVDRSISLLVDRLFERIGLSPPSDQTQVADQRGDEFTSGFSTTDDATAQVAASSQRTERTQDAHIKQGCQWPLELDQTLRAVVDAVLSFDRVERFAAEERP